MGAEPREVHRDDWLLIVDKPAGMPAQATRQGEPGLFEWLKAREDYVALHHRLDRNASGLVLFALDPSVNRALTEGFRNHTIRREYRARVEGEVVSGTWSWPVDGKAARTEVDVLGYADGISELTCRLHTGRRHQIRVHAAMNGTPILGDTRYGGDLARPDTRLGLHAAWLALEHPATLGPLEVVSPPPWSG